MRFVHARALQRRVRHSLMSILSGPTAKSHEWAERGSFTDALASAKTEGATTPVTRSNMRALAQMAELLARESVPRWRLVCLGHESEPDPRCPRLAMAVPRVLHAAAHAEKLGLTVELEGFPLCLLGPYVRLAVSSATREQPERCVPCTLRESCPGADAAYLKRYGDDELSPRTGDISSQPKRRR